MRETRVVRVEGRLLSCRALVTPQHAHEVRNLRQVIQRLAAAFFIDVADEIQIEEILPRPPREARPEGGSVPKVHAAP